MIAKIDVEYSVFVVPAWIHCSYHVAHIIIISKIIETKSLRLGLRIQHSCIVSRKSCIHFRSLQAGSIIMTSMVSPHQSFQTIIGVCKINATQRDA